MEKEATIISIISTETTKIKSMEAKANNISNKAIIIKIDIKTNKVAAINNINRREVTIRIISKAHLKILFKEETSTIKARTNKSINTMKLSPREIKPLLILPSYQLLISQLNLMTLPLLKSNLEPRRSMTPLLFRWALMICLRVMLTLKTLKKCLAARLPFKNLSLKENLQTLRNCPSNSETLKVNRNQLTLAKLRILVSLRSRDQTPSKTVATWWVVLESISESFRTWKDLTKMPEMWRL